MHVMKRTPALRTLAGAMLAAALLASGQASALSLMQAYEAALSNDPTYRGAVQDANSGKENAILGRSNLLPQLSASYSASRVHADQTAPDFFGAMKTTHPVYLSHSSTVQVRQPLFSLDAWARYKQGLAQAKYSGQVFDLRGQEMILRVCGAYLDALFATEQVALAQGQRDVYAEQQKVNDHLFEKGEGTKTDMLETQSRVDLAEAQVLEALDNQQNALANLATLIGGDIDALDQPRSDFRIAPLPEGGYEELKRRALAINPDLQSQLTAIEASKQEINKARAGHTPRVDFIGSYSKSNADTLNTYNQESTQRAIGVQVNIPLYSGGAVSAQSRQAVAGLEKARADLQVKTDRVLTDLKKNYASVVSSAARIHALDKAVESAKLLVEATKKSIVGGVRINLDLLNARQQLYISQRDLAQARYNYLNSLLKMRSDVGTLGVDDVREIAGYFN
ncbi:TolC family outer membrane protein [Rugamonas sp. A1-17]|nr:TolC family outer membrane protein [Rugamonas sp. A1-17]